MMKTLWRTVLTVSTILALAGCGNFSLGDSKIEGVVIDEANGKPIAGAIVIVQWKGHIHGAAQGSSVCYHVESVLTDASGKFTIPAWHRSELSPRDKAVAEKTRNMQVYMEGYGNRGPAPALDKSGTIRISRTRGPIEEQLQDIGIGVDYGCAFEDGSNAKLDSLRERSCKERNVILANLGRPAESCQPPFQRILEMITLPKQ